jgi:hypothetical protein
MQGREEQQRVFNDLPLTKGVLYRTRQGDAVDVGTVQPLAPRHACQLFLNPFVNPSVQAIAISQKRSYPQNYLVLAAATPELDI